MMKRWLGLLALTAATVSYQAGASQEQEQEQAQKEANYFLLSYLPGASWNETISYEKQPGLQEHHNYLRELHVSDTIVMGGPVPDGEGAALSVMLLRTSSLEAANRIASQDPGVQRRLIRAEVLPWSVNMSSMRFIRRQPIPQIVDENQSFSLKRIDPETRLNIED